MLVLVYPMFSRSALNADSCYVVIKQLVTKAIAIRDDIHFDILWPSNGKDWSYYRDGFFDLPNVRRLPLRFHPAKIKQVVAFCPFEHGEYLDYKVPYDLVWNHTPEVGDLIRHNVATYNPSGKSAVVNAHHYIVHDSLPYPVEKDQSHVMLRQVVGCFGVDAHVFDSRHCQSMFEDNVRKYASEYVGDHLRRNARVIPHGPLDHAELDPIARDVDRAPVFTFAYNHRLQHYKNYKTTFELFERLHAQGIPFNVVVFGMPGDQMQMSWVSKYPWCEVFISQTRTEYLRKLATCHANVLHSQHETFCISAVESMAFGQVLIAPDGVTFPEITGRLAGNDYPYLFTTEAQSLDMMAHCATHPDDVMAWGQYLRSYVWSAYNVDTWTDQYLTLFDSLVGRHDVLSALKNPEVFREIITSKREWDFDDLRRELYGTQFQGKLIASAQSFPANRIKRLAHQLGYRDARKPRTKDLILVRTGGTNGHSAEVSSVVQDRHNES